ncbi:MAG: OsmC family protein [Verrucomicrobia bacterium]|nr:OsmC family protein [Verrucomicrobiota bacterium]
MHPHPIAFKVPQPGSPAPAGAGLRRVAVQALAGMQKEALVSGGAGGDWRLLCDEGPYLNGTDLAPFPLGFFSAGQIISLGSSVLEAARPRGLALRSLALRQADRYTMQGSFLRGDAVGGALPPELTVALETSANPADVTAVLRAAVAECPALRLLREAMTGVFTLAHNGRRIPLAPDSGSPADDPADELKSISPAPEQARPDLITKQTAAAAVSGVPGGAGSSLHAVQNRTLLIQGEARPLDEHLFQADIGLAQPIGSSFRFLGAARDGTGIAPDSLDYLAAGIAFCFMTQLGRYAQIKKLPLHSYRLVQVSRLTPSPSISTHVFLESDTDDAAAADLVRTGERTCFLHAALRSNLEPAVRAELNGAPLPL